MIRTLAGLSCLAPALAPLVAASPVASPGAGSRAATERVLVTADWPSASLVTDLAERIEASIPVFERGVGWPLPAGERLVFHLFLKQSDMHAAAREVRATFGGTALEVTAPDGFDLENDRWGVGALRGGLVRFRSIRMR